MVNGAQTLIFPQELACLRVADFWGPENNALNDYEIKNFSLGRLVARSARFLAVFFIDIGLEI